MENQIASSSQIHSVVSLFPVSIWNDDDASYDTEAIAQLQNHHKELHSDFHRTNSVVHLIDVLQFDQVSWLYHLL